LRFNLAQPLLAPIHRSHVLQIRVPSAANAREHCWIKRGKLLEEVRRCEHWLRVGHNSRLRYFEMLLMDQLILEKVRSQRKLNPGPPPRFPFKPRVVILNAKQTSSHFQHAITEKTRCRIAFKTTILSYFRQERVDLRSSTHAASRCKSTSGCEMGGDYNRKGRGLALGGLCCCA
jgi:hypothetical protein